MLEEEERTYLANSIEQIANRGDANEAFGVKRGRGQLAAAEENRKKRSIVMHLVATLFEESGNVDAACKDIAELLATKGGWPSYDAEYLRQCWYNYPHLRSTERTLFDQDFPY